MKALVHLGTHGRLHNLLAEGEIVPNSEANGAKDAEGIVAEGDSRIDRRDEESVLEEIDHAPSGPVLHLLSAQIVKEGIDGEIPSEGVVERGSVLLESGDAELVV